MDDNKDFWQKLLQDRMSRQNNCWQNDCIQNDCKYNYKKALDLVTIDITSFGQNETDKISCQYEIPLYL
jgi:hypothetical protein